MDDLGQAKDQERGRSSQGYRVLLPVVGMEDTRVLLPLAAALAADRQGQVIVLHVVPVPSDQSFSEFTTEVRRFREAIDHYSTSGLLTTRVRTKVRVAREIWEEIWKAVIENNVDLLVLGWSSAHLSETVVKKMAHPRLAEPPCDVVMVRPGAQVIGANGWSELRRVLLAIRGGPYAALNLRVSNVLAELADADITLLHVIERAARSAKPELFVAFSPAQRGLERLTRSVTKVGQVPTSIIEEADGHQAIVMGAPARRVASDGWGGPILDAVATAVDTTLVVVKQSLATDVAASLEEEELARKRERPVTVMVNKWFAENTYHCREFADLERLMELKEAQALTISLGLPSLNEEKTVGHVIETIKKPLMDQVPLLDEMVLIDSNSADRTREIAVNLGIPVYVHQEILPQYGAYEGKGEGLWKSLYVLKGDIIAWIDTDIVNIHPRFVYGVLGPLLRARRVQYVKGYYHRPLRRGDKLVASGGGRVTELTARPLLNFFFPELSGLIQPLAGEYAGRRQALERLPFFTGYGVETGLLIDILETFGLRAIAQVDLQQRVHRNKPLPALSPMSFAIIQVIVRRLEDRHKIRLLEEVNKTINQIHYAPQQLHLEAAEIRERERPPMVTLPEYRRQQGLLSAEEESSR
jgi:nucleotide-binding universal stress UspA family protein